MKNRGGGSRFHCWREKVWIERNKESWKRLFRRRKELKPEEGDNEEIKYEVSEGKKFKLSEYKPFIYNTTNIQCFQKI